MSDGPKSPSRPTVKRLFALSGNRCAFSECPTPLVDRATGSIVGEVCHIKGEKPTAPRYDAAQDNHARHGFDNLILLCNVHHKVIDDNKDDFPEERLVKMKEQHETCQEGKDAVDDATSEAFTSRVMNTFGDFNEVVQALHVSGGQVAHTINNYGGSAVCRIATHVGTEEQIDLTCCERHGQVAIPAWFHDTPERMSSTWLIGRLRMGAVLKLYFDPSWCRGTWFVVDEQRRDGEVINLDQLADLRPSSPTTTTTTTTTPPPQSHGES